MPTESSPDRGDPPSRVEPVESRAEAARRREREATMNGLTVALDRLRRGAIALKAENRQLRDELTLMQPVTAGRVDGDGPIGELGTLAEIGVPSGSRAPGAARLIVTTCLGGLVARQVLDDVELLVSELVTNSVRHGAVGDGDTVLVRVSIAAESLRVEIEDPGTTAVVARTAPDVRSGRGGFGLNLVDLLATRWGVSRRHSTTVWFETSRA